MASASVKSFWNDVVAKDLQGHGTKIFVNFLKAHPDQQKKFGKFAGVGADALAGNAEVQKQAVVVMTKLGELINAADIKAASAALAASHKGRNVNVGDFSKIFPSICDYIGSAGGDKAGFKDALDKIASAF